MFEFTASLWKDFALNVCPEGNAAEMAGSVVKNITNWVKDISDLGVK